MTILEHRSGFRALGPIFGHRKYLYQVTLICCYLNLELLSITMIFSVSIADVFGKVSCNLSTIAIIMKMNSYSKSREYDCVLFFLKIAWSEL